MQHIIMIASDLRQKLVDHRLESILTATAIGTACAMLGLLVYLLSGDTAPTPTDTLHNSTSPQLTASRDSSTITVDVSGEVYKPGVYSLNAGSRLNDALKEAGGITPRADRDTTYRTLNRARILHDQDKIYIPSEASQPQNTSQQTHASTADMSTTVDGLSQGPININAATVDELDSLPGIGQVTAEKIVQLRPYDTVEDLLIKSIVKKNVFESIKDRLTT